jgi:hypothetical protein
LKRSESHLLINRPRRHKCLLVLGRIAIGKVSGFLPNTSKAKRLVTQSYD